MHSPDCAVARCPSVRLSHAGIQSKWLNILSNFFFHFSRRHTILVFQCQTAFQYSDGDPSSVGVECSGYEEIVIFHQYFALYRKCYKTDLHLQWPTNKKLYGLWSGAIFNDAERPLTQISRSRHYFTLLISETVRNRNEKCGNVWRM